MLTGERDISVAVRSINNAQIHHFLQKPFNVDELRMTINSVVERYALMSENLRLEAVNKAQNEELAEAHQKLRQELQFGAKIHQHLLLGKAPANVPNFEVSVFNEASNELDGDFYEFYQIEGDKIDLVVGDVMGKGIPAALAGTAVKTQFSRYTQPYAMSPNFEKGPRSNIKNSTPSASRILRNVQSVINTPLSELDIFVSLFYCRFDIQRHQFTFIDCGSTKPIHYRFSENTTVLIEGENLPLGIVEDDEIKECTLSYAPKDKFVFYTDGITETVSPQGEMFGVDRLRMLIEKNNSLTPDELIEVIKNSVRSFSNQKQFKDDITLIIVQDNNIRFYL